MLLKIAEVLPIVVEYMSCTEFVRFTYSFNKKMRYLLPILYQVPLGFSKYELYHEIIDEERFFQWIVEKNKQLHSFIIGTRLKYQGQNLFNLPYFKHLSKIEFDQTEFNVDYFLNLFHNGRNKITSLIFDSTTSHIPLRLLPGNLPKLERLTISNCRCHIPEDICRDISKLLALKTLALVNNNFNGLIIEEIGELTNLEELNLSGNRLNGPLPTSIKNLVKLRICNLSRCNLSGDDDNCTHNYKHDLDTTTSDSSHIQLYFDYIEPLYQCTNMTALDLSFANLSGVIPAGFVVFRQLQVLILHDNMLTGCIPAEIGELLSLRELDLSWNQLSGVIPSTIGKLHHLHELSLQCNLLSGAIPKEIGNLKSLNSLLLFTNQFSGSIPGSITNLNQLRHLHLQNNNLTGKLPTDIGQLTNLQILYLQNNKLTGYIPASISLLQSLTRLGIFNNAWYTEKTVPLVKRPTAWLFNKYYPSALRKLLPLCTDIRI